MFLRKLIPSGHNWRVRLEPAADSSEQAGSSEFSESFFGDSCCLMAERWQELGSVVNTSGSFRLAKMPEWRRRLQMLPSRLQDPDKRREALLGELGLKKTDPFLLLAPMEGELAEVAAGGQGRESEGTVSNDTPMCEGTTVLGTKCKHRSLPGFRLAKMPEWRRRLQMLPSRLQDPDKRREALLGELGVRSSEHARSRRNLQVIPEAIVDDPLSSPAEKDRAFPPLGTDGRRIS
ncbi:hypothetical protein TIFTF001_016990 [Ficus carica]|uniref:Uncharacterized protein n=1 Tax=Ficus carica TaxID=3494 RepID=A0AA88A8G3_FICCA|nr:hypothetical protein TIFTF001_016990 [Ficus carica]